MSDPVEKDASDSEEEEPVAVDPQVVQARRVMSGELDHPLENLAVTDGIAAGAAVLQRGVFGAGRAANPWLAFRSSDGSDEPDGEAD